MLEGRWVLLPSPEGLAAARNIGFCLNQTLISRRSSAGPAGVVKRAKRVAVLSPVAWRTPPRHYGAWETVASNLAEGLVARGWDVTLFATGDFDHPRPAPCRDCQGLRGGPRRRSQGRRIPAHRGSVRARRRVRSHSQPLRLHGFELQPPGPDTGSDHHPRLLVAQNHADLRKISRRLLRLDQRRRSRPRR